MLSKKIIGAFLVFCLSSCQDNGLYEKVVFLPAHEWTYQNKPAFHFQVTDTASFYQVYFLMRHADAYEFNNVWINLSSKLPGDSIARDQQFEIPLANAKGWLGSGMDDIFDHRVLLYKNPVKFGKPGTYDITIRQDMRVNPLKHVHNVGLRLEKVK
jgi:gliding motility-associated lipoprotein GldH